MGVEEVSSFLVMVKMISMNAFNGVFLDVFRRTAFIREFPGEIVTMGFTKSHTLIRVVLEYQDFPEGLT